jgi:hypothetical protein
MWTIGNLYPAATLKLQQGFVCTVPHTCRVHTKEQLALVFANRQISAQAERNLPCSGCGIIPLLRCQGVTGTFRESKQGAHVTNRRRFT